MNMFLFSNTFPFQHGCATCKTQFEVRLLTAVESCGEVSESTSILWDEVEWGHQIWFVVDGRSLVRWGHLSALSDWGNIQCIDWVIYFAEDIHPILALCGLMNSRQRHLLLTAQKLSCLLVRISIYSAHRFHLSQRLFTPMPNFEGLPFLFLYCNLVHMSVLYFRGLWFSA